MHSWPTGVWLRVGPGLQHAKTPKHNLAAAMSLRALQSGRVEPARIVHNKELNVTTSTKPDADEREQMDKTPLASPTVAAPHDTMIRFCTRVVVSSTTALGIAMQSEWIRGSSSTQRTQRMEV
jgi:hypothetical protein